jgi:hypothetical protein
MTFDNRIIYQLGNKATNTAIASVENQIGFKFPQDYKRFLKIYGSMELKHCTFNLDSLDFIYGIEYTVKNIEWLKDLEIEDTKVSDKFIPFATTATNKFYCFSRADNEVYRLDFNGYPENFIDPIKASFTDFISNLEYIEF